MLGSVDDNDLLALKRVAPSRRRSTQQQITFYTPERTGRAIYRLFVVSDSYLGLDQQYDLCLDVEEGVEEPADDWDDDEVRLAMLQREREKLEKALMQKMRTKETEEKKYQALGAKPKVRK